MAHFQVLPDKCTKCQTCVRECPSVIIKMDETTGFPFVPEISPAGACVLCSHCVLMCPSDACTLDFFPEAKYRTVDAAQLPSPEQYEALMATRRSVRQFKKTGLTQDALEQILSITNLAPTATNSQIVHWVVTANPETTRMVRDKCKNYLVNRLAEKPDDAFATRHLYRIGLGADSVLRNAPHVAITMVKKEYTWPDDGVIALTHFDNACHALGYGSCWGGLLKVILTKDESLREFLGIGDDMQVCGTILFGEQLLNPCLKLPIREMVKVRYL
jgi:nitroreductase/NAD-dependent dihydropyrimidine dehydrogenase PreA subunit